MRSRIALLLTLMAIGMVGWWGFEKWTEYDSWRLLPTPGPGERVIPAQQPPITDERSIPNLLTSEQAKLLEDAVATKLPLTLVGTLVHSNFRESVASIRIQNHEAETYLVDSKLGEVARITLIVREKVVFRRLDTKKLEFIQLGPFDPALAPSTDKIAKEDKSEFHLSRSMIDEALKNLPELVMDARAVPLLNTDGSMRGYQIVDIKPGSLFEKLGIVSGDTIDAVEGQQIKSPGEAMDAFNRYRDRSMITLSLERNGVKHQVTYLIR